MNAVDIKRYWPFLLLIPLAAAAVAGWFLLPDALVMQIGADGLPSNSMPKLAGLALPLAVGGVGAYYACGEAQEKHLGGFILLGAAACITVLTFLWNV